MRNAESWVSRAASGAQPQPTPIQADFVVASRRHASRRQRAAVGISLGVAALAVGLSIFAVLQRNEANRQRGVAEEQRNVAEEQRGLAEARARAALARALASQSRASLEARPELAVLRGLESLTVERTPDGISTLAAATETTDGLRAILRGHADLIEDLAVRPDGTRLAAGGLDLWNLETLEPIGEPIDAPESFVHQLAFSADGSVLMVANDEDVFLISSVLWDGDLERYRERLCPLAGRNPTKVEWGRFLPGTAYRTTCPEWPAAA